ncbi:hypothetical protein JOB18_004380 [Solea senegalensis]|uniref:Uncharacterized protein n=1 Tax=Solea senegalensis TaxID=28829 RepID=A0AAV6RQX5_SOLSE|nr:hypothetical protein JOB18_004380 [Solea senegalensis]
MACAEERGEVAAAAAAAGGGGGGVKGRGKVHTPNMSSHFRATVERMTGASVCVLRVLQQRGDSTPGYKSCWREQMEHQFDSILDTVKD